MFDDTALILYEQSRLIVAFAPALLHEGLGLQPVQSPVGSTVASEKGLLERGSPEVAVPKHHVAETAPYDLRLDCEVAGLRDENRIGPSAAHHFADLKLCPKLLRIIEDLFKPVESEGRSLSAEVIAVKRVLGVDCGGVN